MSHPSQALPQPLDPGAVPLDGINLIEASAGTGKTYNITALFLRALLAFRDRPDELAIPNVLVVTFTEAATQELRERIRGRLREAIHALETGSCADKDRFLADLLAAQTDEGRAELARYLTTQLRRFDEAAIFTIHGFCQRVLQENTFDAGSLFDLELTQNDGGLIRDAVEDVWRRQLHTLDAGLAAYLSSQRITPAALADDARLVLGKPKSQWHPHLLPEREAVDPAELDRAYAELRECWRSCREAVREQILECREGYKKNAVLYTRPESLFQPAQLFFSAVSFAFTTHDLEALKYFRASEIAKAVRKGEAAPEDIHGFFRRCEEFVELASGCDGALAIRLQRFRQAFFRDTAVRLRELKQQRQLQSFDDLLNHVCEALERNPELGARLHARYPIALIDEFQDTDPVQYAIFESIYRPRGGALFMIGDPKQAIYGFRGGDIFTYIQARGQADAGRAYTLGENHRSVRGLVEAVNRLFADAGVPTFGYDAIPFLPVIAKGRCAEHLSLLDGQPQAPFQLMAVPGAPMKAGPARRFIARHTANAIALQLNLGREGRLLLQDRPVAPADIAVLVRSHKEGRLMREALAACGVRSVEYTQDSLFDSDEAWALEWLLRAVTDPGDKSALPTALASPLMGQSAETVFAVKEGGPLWENWYQRFHDYQALWLREGVAAMLQRLLHDRPQDDGPSIAETLVRSEAGERRLTNLLHLIEVLQEASGREQLGTAGLVKWLARQRDPSLRVGEARELRLESDEKLVKIITVHKSKGLQYPIVYCPFLWSTRKTESAPFVFHTEDGRAALELGSKRLPDYGADYARHQELAKAEARQEEMRLLYVALTRAQYQCFVAFGSIGGKKGDSVNSALASLLRIDAAAYADEDAMAAALAAFAAGQAQDFGVVRLPLKAARFAAEPARGELSALSFKGPIARPWALSSYTALSRGRFEQQLRADDERAPGPAAPGPRPQDFFGFTRGPHAGSFLHELLEGVDFVALDPDSLQSDIERLAPRYRIDAVKWSAVLRQAIARVLETPLDREGLSLSLIARPARLSELSFHFPLGGEPGLMGYFVGRGVATDRWEPSLRLLEQAPPAGLMQGSIDLVFRHQGRYYLADYKSNHLGDDYADYAPTRLHGVMDAEGYRLQYLIYTVALHRYLASRLPGYDYARDFGGAFYLFLRGMHPEHPGGGVYFDKPDESLIRALDAWLRGGEPDA